MILLRALKNNRIEGIIFIILLMAVLWLKSFLHPLEIPNWDAMPFYHFLFDTLEQKSGWNAFFSAIIYGAICFILTRFNTNYFLLPERSFMPASLFILLAASYPQALLLNPFIIAALFLLIALYILIESEGDHSSYAVFNASIFLGLGSLFYLKLIFFIPFIWIAISILRPIKWRELIYPILVYMLIALFYITYYWVFKDDFSLFTELLHDNLSFPEPNNNIPKFFPYLIGYIIVLVFISSFYMIRRLQAKKIIIRKIYQVFLIFFIFAVLFFVFISKLQIEAISFLAIPVSYLFANYFHRKKSHWIHEVFIWIWAIGLAYLFISI